MHGQKFGGARRQSIWVTTIRHDVRIVAEVVLQAESMPKFMGYCPKVKITRNQRNPATFAHLIIYSSGLITMYINCAGTIVDDDEVIILRELKLKRASAKIDLIKHFSDSVVVVIVPFGMLPIDAMHQRLTLRIGFNAEGCVAVAMRLHLLGIEGLNPAHHRFHFINHPLTIRAVIGQEVDHPHRALLTHVPISQPLASREGMIAPIPLVIKRHAEMHAVGRWGQRMDDRQRREHEAD